ncbi:hypothetical protein IWX92DRAFT_142162 [Phyllosticta citricarpa]
MWQWAAATRCCWCLISFLVTDVEDVGQVCLSHPPGLARPSAGAELPGQSAARSYRLTVFAFLRCNFPKSVSSIFFFSTPQRKFQVLRTGCRHNGALAATVNRLGYLKADTLKSWDERLGAAMTCHAKAVSALQKKFRCLLGWTVIGTSSARIASNTLTARRQRPVTSFILRHQRWAICFMTTGLRQKHVPVMGLGSANYKWSIVVLQNRKPVT